VTWTSYTVKMRASTSNTAGVGIFADCMGLVEIDAIDYGGITQGYHYERAVYIKNKGTVDLYITYLPTNVYANDGQTHFIVTVFVTEYGLPCQLSPISVVQLLEKDVNNPAAGFLLAPGKMIKLDVVLSVDRVWIPQLGSSCWEWDFTIHAANIPHA